MIELAAQQDTFQASFDRLTRSDPGNIPAWLIARRSDALRQFRAAGWPTADDEEWRSTSVKPIADAKFSWPPPVDTQVSADAIAPHRIASAAELVFVNGRYRSDLSHVPADSAGASSHSGVCVLALADALDNDAVFLESHLGRYAPTTGDTFTALNAAFLHDGAVIHLGAGTGLDDPIHLLFLSVSGPSGGSGGSGGLRDGVGPWVCHPHNLVIADSASRATVIEDYVALDGGMYWNNAVTELVLGPQAQMQYYLLEQESLEAFHIATLRAVQAGGSRLDAHTALFGATLARHNVYLDMAGDDIHGLVNGLFVGSASQHLDNHMRIVHAGLRGQSRQFYKGILSDQAQGVFTGRILVRPGAQQTDAKQTNRNLLLSDAARIDTRPQLEIYADDVKCTHGATTGRLDDNAAFYLQSRGLSPQAARALLIYAFARESLDRMALAPVRDRLERLLLNRLAAVFDNPEVAASTTPILA